MNTVFKRLARPVIRQTKEVIAEELVTPTSSEKPVKAEVINTSQEKDDRTILFIGMAIGALAMFLLTRGSSVKVYVVK